MTIFKPSNRKYFSVEFTDITGKKVRKSLKVLTKREANKIAPSIIHSHNESIQQGNTLQKNQECKLSVLLENVYRDRWSKTKDHKNMLTRCKKLVDILGDIPVSEITPQSGLKVSNSILSEGFTQSTCNRYLVTLGTALNDAKDIYEIIQTVPKFRKFKEFAKKDRYVSKEEEEFILLKTQSRPEMHDLIILLVDTGIRLSACLNLKPHNIDLDNSRITIFGEEQKGTKTRSISMTRRVRETIDKRTNGNLKPLFTMSKDACTNYMRKFRVRELPESYSDITLHTFRHTFASRLVQAGVRLYVVQYLLGHSSIKTTQRYAHLDDDSATDAIQNLE